MAQADPTQSGRLPRPSVSAAVFRDARVLLVQRAKPPFENIWTLPGGHIEAGEEARAAVHRELLEETGIRADLKGVVDVADVILRRDDGALDRHYVIAVYYGRWLSGEAKAASDTRALRWVELSELGQLELTDGAHRIILNAYDRLTSD
jgi:ADP-ribose pyrophosphatase YjhB (NUDIX family)